MNIRNEWVRAALEGRWATVFYLDPAMPPASLESVRRPPEKRRNRWSVSGEILTED